MLRTIFLKTLRDYRFQILIWGGGLALLMLTYVQSYTSLFSGPDQAKLVADYKKTADSFTFITGKPYDLDTVGGFITFKIMSVLPVLLGIFGLMVGSGIIRGEEEKGSLDLLLSTPHSRTAVLLQKWAGMVVVLLAIGLLSSLGLIAGAASANVSMDAGAAIVAHLNVMLAALIFGSLALVFGQLSESRKAAGGWAGGLLATTYLMNSMADTVNSLQWLGYFSPFYYYNLSKPLAVSVGTNGGAMAIQAVVLVPLVVAAWLFYLRRDHNGVFTFSKNGKVVQNKGKHKVAEPTSAWLANNFAFGLRVALPGILIWGLGISVYVVMILATFNDIRSNITDMLSGNISKQLNFGSLTTNENLLSVLLLLIMVILCAAYAVVQVSNWTGEENGGRLELILSTPKARWRLLIGQFSVALLSTALMIGITAASYALSTWLFNVPVDAGNSVAAFFGLWVICAIIEAAGFVLAALGPGWAVAICGGLVVISYVVQLLENLLNIPGWLVNLSVFHQYGTPLVKGLEWTPQWIMLGLSIAFVVIAGFRFWQRDITK